MCLLTDIQREIVNFGAPKHECEKCGAIMWKEESTRNGSGRNLQFNLCCRDGLVQLPLLAEAPPFLKAFLEENDTIDKKDFRRSIRAYNSLFSFTSMGGKVGENMLGNRGPYTFRVHGENYHRIGSLLPKAGKPPQFCQLYIYDTEHEVRNRISILSGNKNTSKIDENIVKGLQYMLDTFNPYVQVFRTARDRFDKNISQEFSLRILDNRSRDARQYNRPSKDEVAVLIIGGTNSEENHRDIILCTNEGVLKRINEVHPSYMALQYPLLF